MDNTTLGGSPLTNQQGSTDEMITGYATSIGLSCVFIISLILSAIKTFNRFVAPRTGSRVGDQYPIPSTRDIENHFQLSPDGISRHQRPMDNPDNGVPV